MCLWRPEKGVRSLGVVCCWHGAGNWAWVLQDHVHSQPRASLSPGCLHFKQSYWAVYVQLTHWIWSPSAFSVFGSMEQTVLGPFCWPLPAAWRPLLYLLSLGGLYSFLSSACFQGSHLGNHLALLTVCQQTHLSACPSVNAMSFVFSLGCYAQTAMDIAYNSSCGQVFYIWISTSAYNC